MANFKYKRLTGERTHRHFALAFLTRSSLWLGEDHLLLVERKGFTETYKRFYFRDIQAITIYRTQWRGLFNLLLGLLAVLLLLIGAKTSTPRDQSGWWACLILTVLFSGIPLLINNLLGPTTVGQIRTAVQTEDLPSLCRVRQAQRVLARIRPLIASAQGQLRPEEAATRMQELVRAASSPAPATVSEAQPEAPPAPTPQPAAPGAIPPALS